MDARTAFLTDLYSLITRTEALPRFRGKTQVLSALKRIAKLRALQ